MKKTIVTLLVFSLFFMSGCGEAEKPQRSAKNELKDKKDNLYRKLAVLKEDIMAGEIEGWRAKLDAHWIHGDIIDAQMSEYMNEIKRIALQVETEQKHGRLRSDLTVDPTINENVTVTEEILTAYLSEILAGIDAETLVRWEISLDKVYLHGNKLTENHHKLIKDIEKKGAALTRKVKMKNRN